MAMLRRRRTGIYGRRRIRGGRALIRRRQGYESVAVGLEMENNSAAKKVCRGVSNLPQDCVY
jgi:hypothetical protein